MSTNRFGLLPFKEISQPQDWELLGYYNNWQLSLIPVPYDQLVSFRTPLINALTTISEFKARKIGIKGDVKTIYSEIELDVSEISSVQTSSTTYFYRNQQTITDGGDYLDSQCVYEIYIKDSADNEYLSAPVVTFDESTAEKYLIMADAQEFALEGTHDGEPLIIER